MNKDIRVATNFLDHPKIRKLQKRLGPQAVLGLIRIWCYAGTVAFDGVLKDLDPEDIGHIAHWTGNPTDLTDKLVELKLLDLNSDTFVIHDWIHWNNFAATFPIRSEIAKKAVAERERKRREGYKKQHDKSNRSTQRSTSGSSPIPVQNCIELGLDMYQGGQVDAHKESQFFFYLEKLKTEEKKTVFNHLEMCGVQLPDYSPHK